MIYQLKCGRVLEKRQWQNECSYAKTYAIRGVARIFLTDHFNPVKEEAKYNTCEDHRTISLLRD